MDVVSVLEDEAPDELVAGRMGLPVPVLEVEVPQGLLEAVIAEGILGLERAGTGDDIEGLIAAAPSERDP
jgi:hypothetical protein